MKARIWKVESKKKVTTIKFKGALHVERTQNMHNLKLKKINQKQGRFTIVELKGALHAKTTQGIRQSKVGKWKLRNKEKLHK